MREKLLLLLLLLPLLHGQAWVSGLGGMVWVGEWVCMCACVRIVHEAFPNPRDLLARRPSTHISSSNVRPPPSPKARPIIGAEHQQGAGVFLLG